MLTEQEQEIKSKINQLITIRNKYTTTEAKADLQLEIDKLVSKLKVTISNRELGLA